MDQNQSIDILSYAKALTRRIWTILIVFATFALWIRTLAPRPRPA